MPEKGPEVEVIKRPSPALQRAVEQLRKSNQERRATVEGCMARISALVETDPIQVDTGRSLEESDVADWT